MARIRRLGRSGWCGMIRRGGASRAGTVCGSLSGWRTGEAAVPAVTTRAPGCLVERCRNAPGQVAGFESKGDLAAADRIGNERRKAGMIVGFGQGAGPRGAEICAAVPRSPFMTCGSGRPGRWRDRGPSAALWGHAARRQVQTPRGVLPDAMMSPARPFFCGFDQVAGARHGQPADLSSVVVSRPCGAAHCTTASNRQARPPWEGRPCRAGSTWR